MPLPLILLGISALGGIAGGISSSIKQRKADQEFQRRRDESNRRFLQESNTNYLDTAAAKSTISALRKQGDSYAGKNDNMVVNSVTYDQTMPISTSVSYINGDQRKPHVATERQRGAIGGL